MTERPRVWRVRVLREIEDWVEVRATTREGADAAAKVLPGVKELRGVTILGEKVAASNAQRIGVEDEAEED